MNTEKEKKEFLSRLYKVLDSALYNWDIMEDCEGYALTVDDIRAAIIDYNQ